MSKENKGCIALSTELCVSFQQQFQATHKATLWLWNWVSSCFCIPRDPRACFSLPWALVVLPIFSVVHPAFIHLSQQKRNSWLKLPGSSVSWYFWRSNVNCFHSFKSFKLLDGPVRFWYITDHLMSSNYLLTDSNRFIFMLLNDFEDFRRLRSCHSFCTSL